MADASSPPVASDASLLRVAFLAGSLGQGGAEKQLLYVARELRRARVDARVFTLTRGERLEPWFETEGVPVTWVGRHRLPIRPIDLTLAMRRFRPHVIQAAHYFTNLYVAAAARASGAVELGTIRNDMHFDRAECGWWGPALLHVPRTIVANSHAAASAAHAAGLASSRVHVLANAIDLAAFDRAAGSLRVRASDAKVGPRGPSGAGLFGAVLVVAVARLVPAKRLDRLLRALAHARAMGARLCGTIVGDGPERGPLEALAGQLDLIPDGVRFTGAREDVPRVLAGADVLASTSQHEGCPNVLLEAMAARLPVVTTPAGDAAIVVRHGETGFVVPFDDDACLTARLMDLTQSHRQRQTFGHAGRARVEAEYGIAQLADRALRIYREAAVHQRRARTLRALDAWAHAHADARIDRTNRTNTSCAASAVS